MQLDQYLQELNKINLLSSDEEQVLWDSFKEQGNMMARQRIIESYQPLVFRIAMPFRDLKNIMDVLQEGTVGLIESVEAYDYTRGVAFSVFATYRIRGRMYRFLQKEGRADVACLEAENEDGYTRQDLIADMSSPVPEIAELHEVTGRVRQAMDRLPDRERQVLSQVYIESHEVKQVAQDMNLSTTHIYRLQKSGVRRIRGMLSSFMHHWK